MREGGCCAVSVCEGEWVLCCECVRKSGCCAVSMCEGEWVLCCE